MSVDFMLTFSMLHHATLICRSTKVLKRQLHVMTLLVHTQRPLQKYKGTGKVLQSENGFFF